MKTSQLVNLGFDLVADGGDREIESVYCGDLLSLVMSRAPSDTAWVTVMGNVNAAAVASLGDFATIVIAEGMEADAVCLDKAKVQGINIYKTALPVFEAAYKIYKEVHLPFNGEVN
jgi:hypothetical protein